MNVAPLQLPPLSPGVCDQCESAVAARRRGADKRFCSDECRQAWHRRARLAGGRGWPLLVRAVMTDDEDERRALMSAALAAAREDARLGRLYGAPASGRNAKTGNLINGAGRVLAILVFPLLALTDDGLPERGVEIARFFDRALFSPE